MLRRAFMLIGLALTALFVFAVPAFAADAAPGDGSGLGTTLGVVAAIGVVPAVIKLYALVQLLIESLWVDALKLFGSFVAAFLILLLYSQSQVTTGVDVGGFDLHTANVADLLVLTVSFGGSASLGYDLAKKRAA